MAKAVIGWVNRALTATLAVTSEQAGMPKSYLVDDHVATRWRSTGLATQNIDLDFGASLPIGAVAVIGANLTAAATWRITMDNASQAGTGVHDSGTIATGISAATGQAIYALAADVNARFVRLALSDAANPDGWIEVGALFAGPLFRPTRNFSYGRALGWVDPSTRSRSRGGNLFADIRDRFRVTEFELKGLTEAELHSDALEMDRILGLAGNLLFVPDYESAYKNYDSIFGVIADATPGVHAAKPAFAKRYRIEERQ